MAHTCRGTINLVTAHIDTEDACNIVLSSGGRTYHLKASTEVERQRWVTALELAKAKAIRMMNDQSAERTIRASLPNVKDIYHKRVESRAKNIRRDDTHPNASLFTLLPLGRRLRSLNSRTERLKRSFYPQAVRHLNSNF